MNCGVFILTGTVLLLIIIFTRTHTQKFYLVLFPLLATSWNFAGLRTAPARENNCVCEFGDWKATKYNGKTELKMLRVVAKQTRSPQL